MSIITVKCPICENDTIDISVEVDNKYGADADGNRGERSVFTEFDRQACACAIDDHDIQEAETAALEEFMD